MKNKYEKQLFEANTLAMKCQKINLWGASATPRLYITAYEDFSEVLEKLRNIIYHVEQVSNWEKCIHRFKNDPDFDKENVLSDIAYHDEKINESLNALRDFVTDRETNGWNIKA